MGQRTQIIIVEDIIDLKKQTGSRWVTAHHDQWGYGRPVVFDILALGGKLATGSFLCPYWESDKAEQSDVYKYRTLLHHNSALKECDVNQLSGALNLLNKSTESEKKAEDMTAMDFVGHFDEFDNNNGGAVLWIVHARKEYTHTINFKYGCLLGGEDSDNPFAGFIDMFTYVKRTNPRVLTPDFVNYVESGMRLFEMSLLDEDDTLRTLLKE